MNLFFYLFIGIVLALLLLLGWSLGAPKKRSLGSTNLAALQEAGRRHVTYFPQIRQAMAAEDFAFLVSRAPGRLARHVRKERQRIVLSYLSFLHEDFQSLLGMARVIAVLSPEVAVMQEWERLRLTLRFFWQYEIIRLELVAGFAPLPQLSGLANVVSGLSVRMESAIKELGERAAMASELA